MQYLPEIDCKIPSIDLLSLVFGEFRITPLRPTYISDLSQIRIYHGPRKTPSYSQKLAMKPTS